MLLWRLCLGAGERVTSLALSPLRSPLGSPLGLAAGGAEGPQGEGPASQAAAAYRALAAASYSGALSLFRRRLAASAGWGPWQAVALAAAGGGSGGAAKGAAAVERNVSVGRRGQGEPGGLRGPRVVGAVGERPRRILDPGKGGRFLFRGATSLLLFRGFVCRVRKSLMSLSESNYLIPFLLLKRISRFRDISPSSAGARSWFTRCLG